MSPSHHSFLPVLALCLALAILPSKTLSQNDTASCPLDFNVLPRLLQSSHHPIFNKDSTCQYIRQFLRLVKSHYLRTTGFFAPPLNSSESCWSAYQKVIDRSVQGFNIRSSCGFQTQWMYEECLNITTRAEFEARVPNQTLSNVISNCKNSLENASSCRSCTSSLSSLQAYYLNGTSLGNLSDCAAYVTIYAGAFANMYGPTDEGTAICLFSLDFFEHDYTSSGSMSNRQKVVILAVVIGGGVGCLLVIGGVWFLWLKIKKKKRKRGQGRDLGKMEVGLASGLGSMGNSITLVNFTFDDIKKATRNFCRDYIIGRGGYGNVYKGVLPDGSEVALKRFKNCSASGDASFKNEAEVIASVRHVNLVALRGYCTATTQFEGHQRIIVCDLMKNGSLYDHLFGSSEQKLSWPIRQKIALGTARGLAYLHYGAQPRIIHRDIKTSNILLDEMFEAKVADFGLAKFTPEGMTHMSTRAAGTMGYVAPEYALYGQLTERSDVYSFGVVLLELLSGKKALVAGTESQPFLVTDWAWSLVRKGRALDVIEDGIPELGVPKVVEKYVLVAVLCSHPELYARPTMEQVVIMLETDTVVPSIPERPLPPVTEIDDI